MMATNDDVLHEIDAKMTALRALAIDRYLRETGIAKVKERSIDQMLTGAGLPARTIPALLGRTPRAVQLQLQEERKTRDERSARRSSTPKETTA